MRIGWRPTAMYTIHRCHFFWSLEHSIFYDKRTSIIKCHTKRLIRTRVTKINRKGSMRWKFCWEGGKKKKKKKIIANLHYRLYFEESERREIGEKSNYIDTVGYTSHSWITKETKFPSMADSTHDCLLPTCIIRATKIVQKFKNSQTKKMKMESITYR